MCGAKMSWQFGEVQLSREIVNTLFLSLGEMFTLGRGIGLVLSQVQQQTANALKYLLTLSDGGNGG